MKSSSKVVVTCICGKPVTEEWLKEAGELKRILKLAYDQGFIDGLKYEKRVAGK